jgi:hypothetical protein
VTIVNRQGVGAERSILSWAGPAGKPAVKGGFIALACVPAQLCSPCV